MFRERRLEDYLPIEHVALISGGLLHYGGLFCAVATLIWSQVFLLHALFMGPETRPDPEYLNEASRLYGETCLWSLVTALALAGGLGFRHMADLGLLFRMRSLGYQRVKDMYADAREEETVERISERREQADQRFRELQDGTFNDRWWRQPELRCRLPDID